MANVKPIYLKIADVCHKPNCLTTMNSVI